MDQTTKNKRPVERTVRPKKVAEAKKRIAIGFYDQAVVIEIAIRRILKDIDNAA